MIYILCFFIYYIYILLFVSMIWDYSKKEKETPAQRYAPELR